MTNPRNTAGVLEARPRPTDAGKGHGRLRAGPQPKVAVIVPTYNEADNLPELVDRLFALGLADVMLIVVDDGSPDGTGRLARGLAQRTGAMEVIQRTEKRGLGTAYVAGFRRALAEDADYVVQMDADLSHDPGCIPTILEGLDEADVVVGSRYTPGGRSDPAWGPLRRLLSMAGNRGIRALAGLTVRDATSGFKGFRAEALRSIDLDRFRCRGFAFQAEMAVVCQRMGLKVVERPIIFETRTRGRSKMSVGIVAEAIWRLIPLAWSKSPG